MLRGLSSPATPPSVVADTAVATLLPFPSKATDGSIPEVAAPGGGADGGGDLLCTLPSELLFGKRSAGFGDASVGLVNVRLVSSCTPNHQCNMEQGMMGKQLCGPRLNRYQVISRGVWD